MPRLLIVFVCLVTLVASDGQRGTGVSVQGLCDGR